MDHPVYSPRFHFPGLDSIRLYAALAVIVEHVSVQFSPKTNLFVALDLVFIDSQNAVNLFFVLSGFLISYLLLQEHAKTGRVNIQQFYIRRMLRIWPLYYLIVILGLVVYPLIFGKTYPLANLPIYKTLLIFLLFPNFAQISAPMIHIWSIGVEEQFYSAWPWVMRNKKWQLSLIFGIIIVKLTLALVIPLFNIEGMLKLFNNLRFECMAIGALGAYTYAKRSVYLQWFYHPAAQIAAIGIFIILSIYDLRVNTYNTVFSSLVFILLILNIATNKDSLIKLIHPRGEELGKISYGLYLYHFPILYLMMILMQKNGLSNFIFSPALLGIGTLGFTWLVSAMSYRLFETPFLDLKKRLDS